MHALQRKSTGLSFPFLSIGGILEVPEERCPTFKFSSRISDLWLSEMHNPLRLHYELLKRERLGKVEMQRHSSSATFYFLLLELY